MADINPLKLVDLGNGIGQLKEMDPATDSLPGSYTSVTLADQASSNSLPPVGSQSPQSAIQILRNLGKWILDKFNTLGTASTATLDTDPAFTANSDTRVPSQKAVKSFVENIVTGLLDFKGDIDASSNPNYPAAQKGDAYTISASGKIGGTSGVVVDTGDVVVAKADNSGGTQAAVGSSWFILEHNLQGALLAANNLSDVTNSAQARTNLGAEPVISAGTTSQYWRGDKSWASTDIFLQRKVFGTATKDQIDAAYNGIIRVNIMPQVYKDQGLTDYGTLLGLIGSDSDTCAQWYYNYDSSSVFYRTGSTSSIASRNWIKVPSSSYRVTNGGTDNTAAANSWWAVGSVDLSSQSSVAKLTILGTTGYGSGDQCAGETVIHLRRTNNGDPTQGVVGYFFGQTMGASTITGVAILLVDGLYRIFVKAAPYSALCVLCDSLRQFFPESIDAGSTLPSGAVILSSRWQITIDGVPAIIQQNNIAQFLGDVETTSTGKGLILKSPNGTRWRVTVDNTGSLTTTSL